MKKLLEELGNTLFLKTFFDKKNKITTKIQHHEKQHLFPFFEKVLKMT